MGDEVIVLNKNYLIYVGFNNIEDARKVYILENSCMDWSKLLEVELFSLLH